MLFAAELLCELLEGLLWCLLFRELDIVGNLGLFWVDDSDNRVICGSVVNGSGGFGCCDFRGNAGVFVVENAHHILCSCFLRRRGSPNLLLLGLYHFCVRRLPSLSGYRHSWDLVYRNVLDSFFGHVD